ncbi:hypothetical protein GWI33_018959 [Rhynchophorus ferrugineus]|uniref:Uncharacterized protein n=1 Tax=Rhynchophorus ferrugineus TaxID=354439 RepID=A0A834HVU4_RHYFE|nr:hypothetical protein GWI33_018959 [Rhynchophorus ferrugineus]
MIESTEESRFELSALICSNPKGNAEPRVFESPRWHLEGADRRRDVSGDLSLLALDTRTSPGATVIIGGWPHVPFLH